MENGFAVMNEEEDLDIAEKSIPSNLKLLETVLRIDPENTDYLLLASQGYSSYSLGFVEDSDIDRARIFYARGKDYGMRILNQNRAFTGAAERPAHEFRKALATFSRKDAPAVFWTAIGWGSAIGLTLTDPQSVAELPKVEAMMDFVLRNDSTYFYGGAHFFLGALAGGRPKLLGGDMDASRAHFEQSLKISGGRYLMTYILFARYYAVQAQDRALFNECLTHVDTASIDILPGARLSNAVAKRKAKLMRGKINEYF